MRLKKAFNNNALLALDDNDEEVIVMGKGIAFGKKSGDLIDESLIQKKFVFDKSELNEKFSQLFDEIPQQYVELTVSIVEMAQKELDVLSLLLRSEKPMAISDIVATNPDYTINMIKPIIRKLCNLEMVEVAGIVYRGTSIARTFQPTKTAHLVLQDIFKQEYQSFRELFTDNSLLLSLVKSELNNTSNSKEIKRLENILEAFKAENAGGNNH